MAGPEQRLDDLGSGTPSDGEERYRSLAESTFEGVVITVDGRIVDANPAIADLTGWPVEELIGRSPRDLVAPEHLEEVMRHITEDDRSAYEVILVRRDGCRVPVEVRGKPIEYRGRQGRVAALRDVSALKESRERLRRSEARFRTLIEHLPDPVVVLLDGGIVYVNPAGARSLGAKNVDEVLGRSPLDFVHPDERDKARGQLVEAADGAPTRSGQRRMRMLDGRERIVHMTTLPIVYDGEPALMSIAHDVTDQQRLEHQVGQTQRMEAVGRLAGGIAHDFNNMLSVILNYAMIGQRHVTSGPPEAQDAFEKIQTAAQRSSELTRQLLLFSQHGILEARPVDVNRAVGDMMRLLQGTLGEHVDVQVRLAPERCTVRLPPAQLEQVLLNLAVNARDAMPDGGQLTITTAGPTANDDTVRITVADTGAGMTDELSAHVFEPFFTTKKATDGSGLGLSVVYGVVTRNRGRITVDSALGRGTTFTIRFPATPEVADDLGTTDERRRPGGHGELVLVVEDEPSVLSLVCKLLKRHDYRAVGAPRPDEALELVDQGLECDLLLTDMVMPGMNGRSLAEAVRERRPGLPVVYMSGYTSDSLDGLDADVPFVAKPFTPGDLLAALDRALQQKRCDSVVRSPE